MRVVESLDTLEFLRVFCSFSNRALLTAFFEEHANECQKIKSHQNDIVM